MLTIVHWYTDITSPSSHRKRIALCYYQIAGNGTPLIVLIAILFFCYQFFFGLFLYRSSLSFGLLTYWEFDMRCCYSVFLQPVSSNSLVFFFFCSIAKFWYRSFIIWLYTIALSSRLGYIFAIPLAQRLVCLHTQNTLLALISK